MRHILIAPQALQEPEALEGLLVTGINKAIEAVQEMLAQAAQPLEHLFPAGANHMLRP